MAQKKAGGSSRNGRDSNPKYLGVKRFGVRTSIPRPYPCQATRHSLSSGDNVGIGRDPHAFQFIRRAGGFFAPRTAVSRFCQRLAFCHKGFLSGHGQVRFIDELEIAVESGDGGDGIVSFLRERARPKGGPNGGDGGKGGDVFMRADGRLNTLLTLRRRRKIKSLNGARGMGKNRQGAAGKDEWVSVPVGTRILDADTVAYMPIISAPRKRFIGRRRTRRTW